MQQVQVLNIYIYIYFSNSLYEGSQGGLQNIVNPKRIAKITKILTPVLPCGDAHDTWHFRPQKLTTSMKSTTSYIFTREIKLFHVSNEVNLFNTLIRVDEWVNIDSTRITSSMKTNCSAKIPNIESPIIFLLGKPT